jgi:hypothetical protein
MNVLTHPSGIVLDGRRRLEWRTGNPVLRRFR